VKNEQSFQQHPDVGFEAKADWQPISKAPRDGSSILAWRKGWDEPRMVKWAVPGQKGDDPTHWYPIPPLPGN
jgi:hypothetical protein